MKTDLGILSMVSYYKTVIFKKKIALVNKYDQWHAIFFSANETNCPSNYIWVSNVSLCYVVFESARTWQDAKSLCEGTGARLAILDTSAKLTAMQNGKSSNAQCNRRI